MPALREVQAAFRRALLEDEAGELPALIVEDGLAAAERLGVYRNNLFASLTAVLRDTFEAVCRLVDERFFAYAAHEFIRRAPPARAVLADYGAGFAGFLAEFPPCRDLAYLADVARLEWLMARASVAAEAEPLAGTALSGIAPEDAPRLLLWLHPAWGFLASPFPVDRIWRANRQDGAEGAAIELAEGGVRLEVSRAGGHVLMRPLDAASFAFRQALAQGCALEAAAASALAAAPDFDLGRGLGDLFRDGAVVAVELPSAAAEATP
ncbi:MAG: putative DNA-binding domain-containing protein [Stellaceae bacterium]